MAPTTSQSTDRDDRIRALIAQGLTLRDVAGRLAISPTHVARLAKALGLKVRKRKARKSGALASLVFNREESGVGRSHAEVRHSPDGPGLRSSRVGGKVGA